MPLRVAAAFLEAIDPAEVAKLLGWVVLVLAQLVRLRRIHRRRRRVWGI